MVSDAKKRADEKYRKEKMKQVVVRFSPRESDLYEHLEEQPNKMGYIKQLIKDDMERGGSMNTKTHYEFVSANKGTVTVDVTGEYRDRCKDLAVEVDGAYKEFDEIDGGSADDVINWIVREGVEFEGTRSMWFNAHYIASVMLDGDATEQEILDEAAAMTEQGLADWREMCVD
ncbi:MAG: hypothetical protein RR619_07325 [Raoultibacter sp.]